MKFKCTFWGGQYKSGFRVVPEEELPIVVEQFVGAHWWMSLFERHGVAVQVAPVSDDGRTPIGRHPDDASVFITSQKYDNIMTEEDLRKKMTECIVSLKVQLAPRKIAAHVEPVVQPKQAEEPVHGKDDIGGEGDARGGATGAREAGGHQKDSTRRAGGEPRKGKGGGRPKGRKG